MKASRWDFFTSKLFGLRNRLLRFRRKLWHRPKYYLAVYAIMHNEAHILREWIEMHLAEGVEHFFLLDHGSTDDWRRAIGDYIDLNIVSVKCLGGENSYSDALRTDYIEWVLPTTEWLLVQDLDEFTFTTGKQRLSDYLRKIPEGINQIAIPWVLFGTCENISQPLSVIDSCIQSEDMALRCRLDDAKRPWHAKSIVRSRYLRWLHVHIHDVIGKTVLPMGELIEIHGNFYIDNQYAARLSEFEVLQNHYIHQSLDFYKKKMERRGYRVTANGKGPAYDLERFEREEDLINAVKNNFLKKKKFEYYNIISKNNGDPNK